MTETRKRAESAADLLDVHILDMAAQIESLLRGVREIQRTALKLRGALKDAAPPSRTHIDNRLAQMLDDCDALRDLIQSAASTAQSSIADETS